MLVLSAGEKLLLKIGEKLLKISFKKESLLINALLEKVQKSESEEKIIITGAKTIIVFGVTTCSFLIYYYLFKYTIFLVATLFSFIITALPSFLFSLILILDVIVVILGKKELKIEKIEECAPYALWALSFYISAFILIFATFIFSPILSEITLGIISLDVIAPNALLFFSLILFLILGIWEYNRIKIEAINRFLKKNTITASLCLRNKEKIKGRISQVEKDKVVISRAKTSTWINQKDILYLELFE